MSLHTIVSTPPASVQRFPYSSYEMMTYCQPNYINEMCGMGVLGTSGDLSGMLGINAMPTLSSASVAQQNPSVFLQTAARLATGKATATDNAMYNAGLISESAVPASYFTTAVNQPPMDMFNISPHELMIDDMSYLNAAGVADYKI